MTLEELYQELGGLTYLIGEAESEEERLSLENQYSEQIDNILQQIEDIENGTA